MVPPTKGIELASVSRLKLFAREVAAASSQGEEFIVEGERTLLEALATGFQVRCVALPQSHSVDVAVLAPQLASTVEVLLLEDRDFNRLAPTVTPQSLMALAKRQQAVLPTKFEQNALVLVLVEVADPGNVGTLIRVADASAARCVVVCGGADPWRPKAVRSSAGSILRVPLVVNNNTAAALSSLKKAGIKIVAAAAGAGVSHDSGVLSGAVAIVVGSEAHGLDPSLNDWVDEWTHIEMAGNTESLNVAMAGTLLAFQAARQKTNSFS